MGIFIAVCGIDASGKATQTEKLCDFYRTTGHKSVTKIEFPNYKSVTGQMILDHLRGNWTVEINGQTNRHPIYLDNPSTYAFQCCHIANKVECLPDAVWQKGHDDIFISDRYIASAYAYGAVFGLDENWLLMMHRNLPQPDINIFLDIPIEESFKRRPGRRDMYEQDGDLLHRVRQCYLDIFKRYGSKYIIVDGSGTEDDVFERILGQLKCHGLVTVTQNEVMHVNV
jgi:dTMP kinase